jgi:cathepsin L/xylem cysteine proteinase
MPACCSSVLTVFFFFFYITAFIDAHNTQNPPPTYTLGHNQFSDLTLDEYHAFNKLGRYSPDIVSLRKSSFGDATMDTAATKLRRRKLQDVPDSVDWVEKGAVVPVKNQGG